MLPIVKIYGGFAGCELSNVLRNFKEFTANQILKSIEKVPDYTNKTDGILLMFLLKSKRWCY